MASLVSSPESKAEGKVLKYSEKFVVKVSWGGKVFEIQYETWLISEQNGAIHYYSIWSYWLLVRDRRLRIIDRLRLVFELTFGYVSESTNWPSMPSSMTDIKHVITPNSIIVLHTGCDCWITLWMKWEIVDYSLVANLECNFGGMKIIERQFSTSQIAVLLAQSERPLNVKWSFFPKFIECSGGLYSERLESQKFVQHLKASTRHFEF